MFHHFPMIFPLFIRNFAASHAQQNQRSTVEKKTQILPRNRLKLDRRALAKRLLYRSLARKSQQEKWVWLKIDGEKTRGNKNTWTRHQPTHLFIFLMVEIRWTHHFPIISLCASNAELLEGIQPMGSTPLMSWDPDLPSGVCELENHHW